MPTKTLSLADLEEYGNTPAVDTAAPAPVKVGQVMTMKDLEMFGAPGTRVAHGPVDPKSLTPGQAAADFGTGVVNHLPLIASTAAGVATGGASIPISMLAAGAGGAAGYLGQEAFHPDRHDNIGSLAKDTLIEGATDAVGEGIGGVLGKGAKALVNKFRPSRLVESALMPGTKLPIDKRERIVQKMLDNGDISPDKEGYKTVLEKVSKNNRDVGRLTKAADGVVTDIDPLGPTFQRNLVDLKKTFATQASPKADMKVLKQAEKDWTERFAGSPAKPGQPTGLVDQYGMPILGPGTPAVPPVTLLPSEAQAIKQGTYRMNRKKYGQLGTAETEFDKTVARGLRDDIVSRVPSVGPIDKDSSEYLELANELQRFVGREGNKRLFGIKAAVVAGSLGSNIAQDAGELALLALDNPKVKVALARVINKAGKTAVGRGVSAAAPYVLPTVSRAVFGGRDGILAPQ